MQPQVHLPIAFAPLITQKADFKAVHGGRASAKSWSVAAALIMLGAEKPLRILCCREVQNSIRDSVKLLIDQQINRMGYRGFYRSTDTEIRGVNGTVFFFRGFRGDPETIKATEGIDIVWVDEARNVAQEHWDALIPTVRKEGSEIWLTWNRKHAEDPCDAMFLGAQGPPPNSVVFGVTWRDNPFFSEKSRTQMLYDKAKDRDKWRHIWEGGLLRISEAAVFKHGSDWIDEPFETPEDAEFYFGGDWGFSVDPSVLVRAFVDVGQGRMYVDREAYQVGCPIDNTPALFAGDDTHRPPRWENPEGYPGIPGAAEWPIVADSARPESIDHLARRGFDIEAAKKGPGSIVEGIEFLKNWLIVVHPRCTHTIDELEHYRYKVDKHTKKVLPVLEDKKNNVIDALRYACEGIRDVNPFYM